MIMSVVFFALLGVQETINAVPTAPIIGSAIHLNLPQKPGAGMIFPAPGGKTVAIDLRDVTCFYALGSSDSWEGPVVYPESARKCKARLAKEAGSSPALKAVPFWDVHPQSNTERYFLCVGGTTALQDIDGKITKTDFPAAELPSYQPKAEKLLQSGDAKWVALSELMADKQYTLWDTHESGAILFSSEGQGHAIRTPDGKTQPIRPGNGRISVSWYHSGGCFSPDGKWLAMFFHCPNDSNDADCGENTCFIQIIAITGEFVAEIDQCNYASDYVNGGYWLKTGWLVYGKDDKLVFRKIHAD